MSLGKILIVDDDKNLLELLQTRIEAAKYEAVISQKEDAALELAQKHVFNLAIVDLKLMRTDGISLMEELHAINPDLPVIILTAHGSVENAVDAMKRGAYSYLLKPFDAQDLLSHIEQALEKRKLAVEIKILEGSLEEKYDFKNIVTRSEKMRNVLQQVARIAQTDSTIYLHGESGTGKELIAKAIHLCSPRKEDPFVAVNCAAIPDTLLESELFGYKKGAFTNAIRNKRGLFEQAHGGTMFLDEIGEMSPALQAKLLRVLEVHQFHPVGAEKPVDVDARLIVATNKDIVQEVKNGLFREDLFYRIHVIPIYLPPLRERKEDIPALAKHFLKKYTKEMKKDIQKLMLYDWPGNVRELVNTIEYAVAMTIKNMITEEEVLPHKDIVPTELKPQSLKEAKGEFEKGYLINLLELTKGNVTKASEMASKYRADFYNLLKKYNLSPKDFKK
ncbi:MAG: sigma-54-dependent Fis family transcriptional regulator [Deltaproteobacteria bacterium]|nr:sigma-54-dependent Fis family transcriptional regulator [Deltaproteobacteria bacterium]